MICNGKETSIDELVILLKGGYVMFEHSFSTFISKKLYQYKNNYYFTVEYAKNHFMIVVGQKIEVRKNLLEVLEMYNNFDLNTEINPYLNKI